MREEFLPYARPTIGPDEESAVLAVLRSGWLTAGPVVRAFEVEFAEACGARHALAVSCATAGFHLLFAALELQPGQEVITPSLTWPAAVNMIEHTGATVVFADVDPDTLQLDPRAVEAAWTDRTRAVLPVHFGGQPADLDALAALCEARAATLVEDAAHAVGAAYRGQPVGSRSTPAVFSFHAVKNLTTGEGGMLTLGDDALAERLRSLRFHGVDHDAWRRHGRPAASYDLLTPGWKAVMTDMAAALGRTQLAALEAANARRARIAAQYDRRLASIASVRRVSSVAYPCRHAHHLYPVILAEGIDRGAFRAALRERGIGTGHHYPAVHRLTYYAEKYPGVTLPHTESVAERIVSLPLYPTLEDRDVDDVADAIAAVSELDLSRPPDDG